MLSKFKERESYDLVKTVNRKTKLTKLENVSIFTTGS